MTSAKREADARPSTKRRFFIFLLLFFVFILTGIASYALAQFLFAPDLPPYETLPKKDKQSAALLPPHRKINILVLGINERRNDIGRSNVTCLLTLDTDSKAVSLLWIPRDSRVNIPGHEWNKIGHAYTYGGPDLSRKTVEDLLGISIDYYLAVNMLGFSRVIDSVGGVDLSIDKRMYYYDPYDEGEVDNNGLIDLRPGPQHLDGNTALQYVRFRHDEMGDIGRIERQHKFARALLSQLASPATIPRIPDIFREINTTLKTDIPLNQFLILGKIAGDAYRQGLTTDMAPGHPVYINEISYWLPDVVATRRKVAAILGLPQDDRFLKAAQKTANEYKTELARHRVVDAP